MSTKALAKTGQALAASFGRLCRGKHVPSSGETSWVLLEQVPKRPESSCSAPPTGETKMLSQACRAAACAVLVVIAAGSHVAAAAEASSAAALDGADAHLVDLPR